MDDEQITDTEVDPSSVHELFVDLRDERVVLGLLRDLPGLGVQRADANATLGLARLRLDGVPEVAAAIRRGDPAGLAVVEAATARFSAGTAPGEVSDMDLLLALLRHWASTRFDGWTPVVDRYRDLGRVSTNPHVKIFADPPERHVPTPKERVPPGRPTGPRIGIADTQVYAHPDFGDRIVGEVLTGPGPFDSGKPGHATFVAGTVLRHAPDARLVCRAVLVPKGPNQSWDVAVRLMSFLDEDVDVLNMSFGCRADGAAPLPLRRAVERLSTEILLVAAVGNHAEETFAKSPLYPAAFAEVMAVGSAEGAGRLAASTPDVPWLDLKAPGVKLVGPFLEGMVGEPAQDFSSGYAVWSGSSFAAAAVTGAIARVMQDNTVDARTARDLLLAATVPSDRVFPFVFTLADHHLLDAALATAAPE